MEPADVYILLNLLGLPLVLWFRSVTQTVPEPYLDEVFHIPQAQQYCAGNFSAWDSKITTPPGLYIISYLLTPVFGCGVAGLRATNLICTLVLVWLVKAIFARRVTRQEDDQGAWLAQHNALNVVLFPPLFFFSALYYTDVASTLAVMLFYYDFTSSDRSLWRQWKWNVKLAATGAFALLFRQTNIFWVAIFPAGIVLVRELDRGHEVVKESMYRQSEGFGDTWLNVAKTSWKMEVVYDPPVMDASIDDFGKCVISLAICLVRVLAQPARLLSLLNVLSPYLVLIASFATFIIYNGGVVLGDKTNHVATLHTPQLLYLWPFLIFFSWPFAYQHLLRVPLTFIALIPALSTLEQFFVFSRRRMLPRILVLVGFLIMAWAMIRYNTIIHPFTLADNRHYTFYVFRLLTRLWWVRYAVLPIYLFSAWLCIQALGSAPHVRTNPSGPHEPRPDAEQDARTASHASGRRGLPLPDTTASANTSFLLIWLATTSLTLITAPLVEPRYFILPWLFFRLHLPLSHPIRPAKNSGKENLTDDGVPMMSAADAKADRGVVGNAKRVLWDEHDKRLWLETGWFLIVNAGTGLMFLRRGFAWEQEPGLVQRFMW